MESPNDSNKPSAAGTQEPVAPKARSRPLIQVLAVVGVVAAFIGTKAEVFLLTTAGFCCFGAAAILLGIDVMVTRRIVLQSRYDRRANETYVGIAAIAQGIDLILLGVFFVAGAVLAQLDLASPLFKFLVRRPGTLLLLFGVFCLTAAVTASVGYLEQKETTRLVYILDLLASRLLPSVILLVIGLAAIALGFVEVFAPDLFDAWGGGFLEVLFGAR